MAELIKKDLFYMGYGNTIVKAVTDEYLDDQNECRFNGMVLDPRTNYVDTEQIIKFNVKMFKQIAEPRERIFCRAIVVYGKKAQYEMLQEEATELALATRHFMRDRKDSFYNLCEEIADIENMIEQFKLMHPEATDLVKSIKNKKIIRLESRVSKIEKGF